MREPMPEAVLVELRREKGARYAAAAGHAWNAAPDPMRAEIHALAHETPALAVPLMVDLMQLLAEVVRGLPPEMVEADLREVAAAVTATGGAWS